MKRASYRISDHAVRPDLRKAPLSHQATKGSVGQEEPIEGEGIDCPLKGASTGYAQSQPFPVRECVCFQRGHF